MPKTVGVIGAGVAGLVAIKCSLDEGLFPICFEKDDDLGGLWNYTDVAKEGTSSLYNSLILNTSKEMTCFSDFPFPKEFPNYMNHRLYRKYLHMYASNFKLTEYIRYQHEVQRVQQIIDDSGDTKWHMTVKNTTTGEILTQAVDSLMVCHGHLHEPIIPSFPGMEKFQGRVMHTHDYKDFHGFEGKRVLVVGIGNSATDVACELSRHAEHVYISTRSGTYVIQRAGDYGVPLDLTVSKRWIQLLPSNVKTAAITSKVNRRYDHSNYGLLYTYSFGAGAITLTDELPDRILVGAITIKSNIKHFTETSAIFEDESKIDNIDVIILGTGYKYSFPFLENDAIAVENHFPLLYKMIFPPKTPSLAVIGLIHNLGPVPPVLEMQARWAARVFCGACHLPDERTMRVEVENRKEMVRRTFKDSARYVLQINFINYMDELAVLIGCKPRLWKHFFTNPKLWYKLFFGPSIPAQWRLDGPGKWSGAQTRMEKLMENVLYPLKTRKVEQSGRKDSSNGWLKLFKIVAFVLMAWFICSKLSLI